jgi:DHA3 family macrolide efflux protein-like MFS transporter
MLSLLLNKRFGSLFWSSTFSALGDSIYLITISWFIAEMYQSGSMMGTILLAMGIARFTFGIIGGAIVDQAGSKKVMVISDLCRALLMVLMWFMVESDLIGVWYLFVLAVTFGIIDAFYWPAVEALQQQIVDVEEYSRANSIYYTLIRMMNMFGPVIGGFLLAETSYGSSFCMTAVAFLVSAAFLYQIQSEKIETETDDSERDSELNEFTKFTKRLKNGFYYVRQTKILVILITTMFFSNIGANGVMAVLPFFVQEMGYDADGLGVIRVAMAVGSFAVGFVFSVRAFKKISIHYVTVSFMGQGLFLALVFWMPELVGASVALFLVGVCTAIVGILIPTILQTVVPQHLIGQVGGMMMTVAMASTPFAHFLFGGLSDLFGAKLMFLIAGAIEIVTGVLAVLYVRFSGTPHVIKSCKSPS